MANHTAAVAKPSALKEWRCAQMSEVVLDFPVVVIGAGPAGLAAAYTAAEAGQRVALVDETAWLGGQIWRGQQREASLPTARKWFERFRSSAAVLLDRTCVIAVPEQGLLLAEHDGQHRQIR